MLIGWFLSIISCNSCSIYHFKKWLQKFVKEKVIKKKTPHLSWTREDRCIQRHLQLFSLLVKVSSSTNHHGFQYLISEVMCCLHPFATLVCLNWKKKDWNHRIQSFPWKICDQGRECFLDEWVKTKPFPHKKNLWMDLPFIKNGTYKSSRIVNCPVLSCIIRTSGELT